MKVSFRRLAGVACVALLMTGTALAEQPLAACNTGCDNGFCGPAGCDAGYDSCGEVCPASCQDSASWGVFAEAELLLLRYHRADGVRIGAGPGEVAEFDFEPGGRYTLGVVGPSGLGFRTRFFRYDRFQGAENAGEGDGIGVETFNVDAEVFDTLVLSDDWAAEVSAGVRYNEFREGMLDVDEADLRAISFNGVGLVAGLEMRRVLGSGHLYARARGALVQGDKGITNVDGLQLNQNVELYDTTHAVIELAWGYETNYQLSNGATLFARTGVEWQNWANYSNEFDFVTGESFFDGPSDVGFAGFTIAGGVSY